MKNSIEPREYQNSQLLRFYLTQTCRTLSFNGFIGYSCWRDARVILPVNLNEILMLNWFKIAYVNFLQCSMKLHAWIFFYDALLEFWYVFKRKNRAIWISVYKYLRIAKLSACFDVIIKPQIVKCSHPR